MRGEESYERRSSQSDLRWKTCFISDENMVAFYSVFHWVSRFVHLTQTVVIYWLLTSWITNEIEKCLERALITSSLAVASPYFLSVKNYAGLLTRQ